jgi:hypothetical protein
VSVVTPKILAIWLYTTFIVSTVPGNIAGNFSFQKSIQYFLHIALNVFRWFKMRHCQEIFSVRNMKSHVEPRPLIVVYDPVCLTKSFVQEDALSWCTKSTCPDKNLVLNEYSAINLSKLEDRMTGWQFWSNRFVIDNSFDVKEACNHDFYLWFRHLCFLIIICTGGEIFSWRFLIDFLRV